MGILTNADDIENIESTIITQLLMLSDNYSIDNLAVKQYGFTKKDTYHVTHIDLIDSNKNEVILIVYVQWDHIRFKPSNRWTNEEREFYQSIADALHHELHMPIVNYL